MLTLIRWLIRRYRAEKKLTPQQRIARLLAHVRNAPADELAGILAGAIQAKKALDTTRLIDTPFPVEILDGHAPLDDSGRTRLEMYSRELERFQGICLAESTILTVQVAQGVEIWIVTLWTLTLSALNDGKELWACLMQGDTGLEAAYRFRVRRDLTDVEQDNLAYRPRILLAG